jgi:hypothetical protein
MELGVQGAEQRVGDDPVVSGGVVHGSSPVIEIGIAV